jgi:uncharacterized protein
MAGPLHPSLGFGLGLRVDHYEAILEQSPSVDWFEALTENYLVPGGRPLHYLARVRERYPVALHGVSMSIGSTAPLDREYLEQLKTLVRRIDPAWVSDHLCWTGVAGRNTHDLLPLPYTEDVVSHVAKRVRIVQDVLERRILLENVSSYVGFRASALTEWEFARAVVEEADCLLLLDLNNVYVSSINHGFDPLTYLDAMPVDRVQQFHLAGHEDAGELLIDTHGEPVPEPVWALYESAVRRFGTVSTLIERDTHIPPLPALLAELEHARRLNDQALARAA